MEPFSIGALITALIGLGTVIARKTRKPSPERQAFRLEKDRNRQKQKAAAQLEKLARRAERLGDTEAAEDFRARANHLRLEATGIADVEVVQ
tara:strand:+ start:648 stop:923 length:276 start_codon:yes stop_codon:yes gene_type:complete